MWISLMHACESRIKALEKSIRVFHFPVAQARSVTLVCTGVSLTIICSTHSWPDTRVLLCPQVLGWVGASLLETLAPQRPPRLIIQGQDRGMFTSVCMSACTSASAWGIEGDFSDILKISNVYNRQQCMSVVRARQHQPSAIRASHHTYPHSVPI